MNHNATNTILLAAALSWLAVAAAQPTPPATADLVVQSFGIPHPHEVPQWTDGVGGMTRLRVEVKNNGTAPASYELDYFWNGTDGRVPLNGAAEASFDLQGEPVGAGVVTVHTFDWQLQPGQEGPGHVEVDVHLVNVNGQGERLAERRYDNNLGRLANVFVKTRALSMAIEPNPVQVEADATGFVRLNLSNGGNAPIRVPLRIAQAPTDVRLHAEIHPVILDVPAHASRTATLYVHFDPAGDFSPFAVQYRIEADPGFGTPRSGFTPTVSMAEPGSLDRYQFALGGTSGGPIAPTTATTQVQLWLANLGVRPDAYTLGATAPEGWAVVVEPSILALKPGENSSAALSLRPPASAPAGSVGQITVVARSSLLPDAAVFDVAVRVAGPAPILKQVTFGQTPYTGQPVTVLVKAANPGNGPVREGSVVSLTVRSPGSPVLDLDPLPVPAVGPGGEALVLFALPPPIAGGLLHVEARWLQTGSTPDPVALEGLVHAVALHLRAPPPLAGAPGETLAYRNGTKAFQLVNLGNAAETVVFGAFAASGIAWVEGATQISLEPGQSWTVPVRQRLPNPAGIDTMSNLTLTATVGKASVANSTGTRIADTQAPVLDPGTLPPRWNAGEHPLPLVLRVQDNGAVQQANVTVVGPEGKRTVLPMTAGADGLLRVGVVLREAGNHTLWFAAVDYAGNRANSTVHVVQATALPKPAVRLQGLPDIGNVSSMSITVVVESELAVASIRAELRQGDLEVAQDIPLVEGRAVINLTGFEPGPVQLLVTAQDASGALGTLQANLTFAPQSAGIEGDGLRPKSNEAPAPAFLAALALALAAANRRRM